MARIEAVIDIGVLRGLTRFCDSPGVTRRYATDGVALCSDQRGTWMEAHDGCVLGRWLVSEKPADEFRVIIPAAAIKAIPVPKSRRAENVVCLTADDAGRVCLAYRGYKGKTTWADALDGRWPGMDVIFDSFRVLYFGNFDRFGLFSPGVLGKVEKFADDAGLEMGDMRLTATDRDSVALITFDRCRRFAGAIMPRRFNCVELSEVPAFAFSPAAAIVEGAQNV